ncbi:MAG: DUF4199 domain-containing protein [Prevotellaceae bacterium]|jgi:hypothetical protein|nr:DUF4199 domain-containing protein [Prevotellaceae bacterium]
MMEKSDKIMKITAGYGLILGFAMIAVYMLIIIFRVPLSFVLIFTYIGGLVYTTLAYREKYLGGIISYGKSLLFGVLVSGFAFIVLGVFFYILISFHQDEYREFFNRIMAEMETKGYVKPQDSEYSIFNPAIWIIAYLSFGLLAGLAVSAITSLFTKKS